MSRYSFLCAAQVRIRNEIFSTNVQETKMAADWRYNTCEEINSNRKHFNITRTF